MKASETVIPAWKMAISNRAITTDLIFHADRGVQYACSEFRDVLKAQPLVIQSMSRKANGPQMHDLIGRSCWDKAVAESFFRTLKSELIYQMDVKPLEMAKIEVYEFIEIWYNRKRIHASLG